MILPKKLKIGNLTYTIKKERLKTEVGQHWYAPNKLMIVVDDRLKGAQLRNVFFHELSHAILYQMGADTENQNELFVQSLANELDKLFELK